MTVCWPRANTQVRPKGSIFPITAVVAFTIRHRRDDNEGRRLYRETVGSVSPVRTTRATVRSGQL